jgi:hypothetical protein
MSNVTIDTQNRAPDAGYVRSDGEVAFQKNYEAREASRAGSAAQISYRIESIPSRIDASYIESRNPKGAFVVVRQVGDGKEERSVPMYRQSEASAAVRENMWRDEMAAKRLGVKIHVTLSTKR